MWNLTPESIQQVKEELKGRRAAIEARYADELKTLDADLEEVETLERVAYAVAVKHLPEPPPPPSVEPTAEMATLQALPSEPEEVAADLKPELKGLSRWRQRLDANSEPETA